MTLRTIKGIHLLMHMNLHSSSYCMHAISASLISPCGLIPYLVDSPTFVRFVKPYLHICLSILNDKPQKAVLWYFLKNAGPWRRISIRGCVDSKIYLVLVVLKRIYWSFRKSSPNLVFQYLTSTWVLGLGPEETIETPSSLFISTTD